MTLPAVCHAVVDLIYPLRCSLCHQPPRFRRDLFCETCSVALVDDGEASCPRCALTVGPFTHHETGCPTCTGQPLHFARALRLGKYEDRLRDAVLLIKHAQHEGLAESLGERWAEARRTDFDSLKANVIVPVPLHWRKRLWRGYNQSASLAFGLGQRLSLPVRSRWLTRIRATQEQKSQDSLTARRANVQGAFRASTEVKGMHVLLIDDVMTTGATASEAAGALLKAGASQISVAILARAMR